MSEHKDVLSSASLPFVLSFTARNMKRTSERSTYKRNKQRGNATGNCCNPVNQQNIKSRQRKRQNKEKNKKTLKDLSMWLNTRQRGRDEKLCFWTWVTLFLVQNIKTELGGKKKKKERRNVIQFVQYIQIGKGCIFYFSFSSKAACLSFKKSHILYWQYVQSPFMPKVHAERWDAPVPHTHRPPPHPHDCRL